MCEPSRDLIAVQIQRSGDDTAAVLDYDIQKERVTLTASQPLRWVLVPMSSERDCLTMDINSKASEDSRKSSVTTAAHQLVQAALYVSCKPPFACLVHT